MHECKHEELCCIIGYWTTCQAREYPFYHKNICKHLCHVLSNSARYHGRTSTTTASTSSMSPSSARAPPQRAASSRCGAQASLATSVNPNPEPTLTLARQTPPRCHAAAALKARPPPRC